MMFGRIKSGKLDLEEQCSSRDLGYFLAVSFVLIILTLCWDYFVILQ
jgi:hypothetical protein